jgi:hypothetical protein
MLAHVTRRRSASVKPIYFHLDGTLAEPKAGKSRV